ncbi:MFS transporter, partial [Rhodospirillum rubrum]
MRRTTLAHRSRTTSGYASSVLGLVLAVGGVYVSQTMVSMIAMQSLPTLLREAGVPLELLGMSAVFMVPWVLKVLWAPAIERLRLPAGDPRRRSKAIILCGQGLLAAVFAGLAFLHWGASLEGFLSVDVFLALMATAVLAASVDVASDGMVVDHLDAKTRPLGNAAQVGGAYIGLLLGTSLFLVICARWGLSAALLCTSALLVLLSGPLVAFREQRRSLAEADHRPSLGFALRRQEVWVGIMAITCLEAGVRTATVMVGPLLIDRGASLELIGWMFGGFTVVAGLAGTVAGALFVRWLGAWKAVFLAYGMQALVLSALALAAEADFRLLTVLVGLKFMLMACGLLTSYSALMGLSSPKQAGVDFTVFQCANALISLVGGVL